MIINTPYGMHRPRRAASQDVVDVVDNTEELQHADDVAEWDASYDAMLTTTDNPWNPFTHYREWFAWDTAAGYHTCGLLARLTVTSNELSEADRTISVENAMNEIVEENVSGMHTLVVQRNK